MTLTIGRVFSAIRTHWYGTVVATVGSLVFLVAELYGDAIRNAWPLYWGTFGGASWPAIIFWFGLAIVTVMLALKNKGDEDARQELVAATDRVTELVQTLPPRGWREDYAVAVNAAADGLQAVVLSVSKSPSEHASRRRRDLTWVSVGDNRWLSHRRRCDPGYDPRDGDGVDRPWLRWIDVACDVFEGKRRR